MEFEVLGPVRVRSADRSVEVRARMLRTLLALLLARANTPVSVDVLIDVLWDGHPVESANKKLQLHVHRLRQRLGEPHRIRLEGTGYQLTVRAGELDADRFDELLAEGAAAGDPARAVALRRRPRARGGGAP
ncbi:MAG: AfsR/SARP family transcriptional regulator, partial [Pseudonocardia sp.]